MAAVITADHAPDLRPACRCLDPISRVSEVAYCAVRALVTGLVMDVAEASRNGWSRRDIVEVLLC